MAKPEPEEKRKLKTTSGSVMTETDRDLATRIPYDAPKTVDTSAETLKTLQAIERHLAVLASTVQPMDRHSLPLIRTRS